MKREIWKNYLNNLQTKRQQTINVFKDKSNLSNLINDNCNIFEDNIYYSKTPHSRVYKNLEYSIPEENQNEQCEKDNIIATTNELILQNKYRDMGIMSTEHIAIYKNFNKYSLTPYAPYSVISQYTFEPDIQVITLFDFLNNDTASTFQLIKNPCTSLLHQRIQMTLPASWGDLEDILKKKKIYLEYLTPNCYDQIIQVVLSSIFEFGDDEHLNNYLLCKKVNSKKFEELCILDKESTAFCMPIVQNYDFKTIKKFSLTFWDYNPSSIDIGGAKNFIDKYQVLLNMIHEGKLDKKYYNFLNTIANTNYNDLAKKVYEQSGIKANQHQIDMLNFGSEKAGDLFNLKHFHDKDIDYINI